MSIIKTIGGKKEKKEREKWKRKKVYTQWDLLDFSSLILEKENSILEF